MIFALFYVSLTGGEQLADRGVVSLALAMWFPNVMVLAAGILGLAGSTRNSGRPGAVTWATWSSCSPAGSAAGERAADAAALPLRPGPVAPGVSAHRDRAADRLGADPGHRQPAAPARPPAHPGNHRAEPSIPSPEHRDHDARRGALRAVFTWGPWPATPSSPPPRPAASASIGCPAAVSRLGDGSGALLFHRGMGDPGDHPADGAPEGAPGAECHDPHQFRLPGGERMGVHHSSAPHRRERDAAGRGWSGRCGTTPCRPGRHRRQRPLEPQGPPWAFLGGASIQMLPDDEAATCDSKSSASRPSPRRPAIF